MVCELVPKANYFLFQPTTLEKFYLNDTRQQLMVHWAGENSFVVVCLAKDAVIGSGANSWNFSFHFQFDKN